MGGWGLCSNRASLDALIETIECTTPLITLYAWAINILPTRSSSLPTLYAYATPEKLLESEADRARSIPESAEPLWGVPDTTSGQDVIRVLCRLFVSDQDVNNAQQSESGETQGENASCKKKIPAMASVAFPSLMTRYVTGSAVDVAGASDAVLSEKELSLPERAASVAWLNDDDATCKALEQDVHALAMLMFVEWREFVSTLPGCGAVLSRETSALWLAQVCIFGMDTWRWRWR